MEDLFVSVVKLAGVADAAAAAALPGATIAQQAAAGAAAGAHQVAGGHGAPKKVATALGAEKYKAPIGSLIIPHEHFIKGQPSHWSHGISAAKWVANQWKSRPDADDAAHKAVEAGTHHWVQSGEHEFAVHKGLDVHVPKHTDLDNPAAVKNAHKMVVKPGEQSEHMLLSPHNAPSEPEAHTAKHEKNLASHWKILHKGVEPEAPAEEPHASQVKAPEPEAPKPQKAVSFGGKHAAWVPHDWQVHKWAGVNTGVIKWAKDPDGNWHMIEKGGKVSEAPQGAHPEAWAKNGQIVPDDDQAADHGVHPLPKETGVQPAKKEVGGIAVTKEEIQQAIDKLNGSKSTQIKGLLKGHPLEASDYHAVYKAELEKFPHLKVPPGTKKAHVPEAKNAYIHFLAGLLKEFATTEAEEAVSDHHTGKAEAAAEHAQDLTPHTVHLPEVPEGVNLKEQTMPPEPEAPAPEKVAPLKVEPGEKPKIIQPEPVAKAPEPAASEVGEIGFHGVDATKTDIQEALDILKGNKSTAIKQPLKAKGNVLANVDYWAVVHEYEAAHPVVKTHGTKQAHVGNAKSTFMAALQEKLDALAKADQLTGHDASAELYSLVSDGQFNTPPAGWSATATSAIAYAAGKAVKMDAPYYIESMAGKFAVSIVKPGADEFYYHISPDLKLVEHIPGGVDQAVPELLADAIHAHYSTDVPEEVPPVPEPPKEAENLPEPVHVAPAATVPVKPEIPKWSAEEQQKLDAAIGAVTHDQAWSANELVGDSNQYHHLANVLWYTAKLKSTRYVMKSGDSWTLATHAQDGTWGAPLAHGFYEVTADHHVIWHDVDGNTVPYTAEQVHTVLDKGLKPKEVPPPPNSTVISFPGGVKYTTGPDATVWQDGSDLSSYYVSESDATWKWVYKSGTSAKAIDVTNSAEALDAQITSGTLVPFNDEAKKLAQDAKAAAAAPPPPPEPAAVHVPETVPPPPPPEPEKPNLGNDIPVTIKGTEITKVPAGSKIYYSAAYTTDTKYVLTPDGKWLVVKNKGTKVEEYTNQAYMKAQLANGSLTELSPEMTPIIVGVNIVGEVPVGTKIYKHKYNGNLTLLMPGGEWYDVSSWGFNKSYSGHSVDASNGIYQEIAQPTPEDIAHVKELAAFKKTTTLTATDPQAAKQSWQAAIAYGLTTKKGDAGQNWVVWKTPGGAIGKDNYDHVPAGWEKWVVNTKKLEGTHTSPDGTKTPITFDEVKHYVQQHMVPNAVELDGKVVQTGYYYNPKSALTYLEVTKATTGYHQYSSSSKYGAAANLLFTWHQADGTTKVVSPTQAAKYLVKNTDFQLEAKDTSAIPLTIKKVSYASLAEEAKPYALWSATTSGPSESTIMVFGDGSASYMDATTNKVTTATAEAVKGLLMSGTMLDKYGTSIVKPGIEPVTYHLFGSKPMTPGELSQLMKDLEEGSNWADFFKEAMSHLPLDANNKFDTSDPNVKLLQAFLGEKSIGNNHKDALRDLIKELLNVPKQKLAAVKGPEPVFLKGLPPGMTKAADVFKLGDHGYAAPFSGTLVTPGSALSSLTSTELAEKIKAISEQFGGGKVVGTHVSSLSKDERIAWLESWRKGDMVSVFKLDASGGKVSPIHPGAPDNADTHQITWSPWDASQTPASQVIEGTWTPLGHGVQIPKSEADNYLIKVGVKNAAYLTYKERRQLVLAHRNHDQETVDSLSKDAANRFQAGGKPLTAPPVWSDNLQPAKSYTLYIEDQLPAEQWSNKAVSDFYKDNASQVMPFLQQATEGSSWVQSYLASHGLEYTVDSYPEYAKKGIQGYLDDVAAKQLLEQLKPKYSLVPGKPGMASDQFGKQYIWHTGSAKQLGERIAVSQLARAWGFKTPLTKLASLEKDGSAGAVTPLVEPEGTLAHLPKGIGALTARELSDIAREHVLDYALANPLSTPGDYLRMADGSIVAADKHGAFANMLWQGANRTAMNDWAKQPVSLIFDAIISPEAHGGIAKELTDKAYVAAVRSAQRMSSLSDSRMQSALKDAKLSGSDLAALLARKAGLADEIHNLWEDVYKQAGWELPPRPAEALTHGLHSGFSEPDYFPHVISAKSFGVPAFFAGSDLAGGNVHTWTELDDKGERLIRGEMTLRGKALKAVVAWVNSHSGGEAAKMAPKDETDFHLKLLTAAEVVNTHAKDFDYSGPISSKAIAALKEAKNELNHRLTMAEQAVADGPTSPVYKTVIDKYGDPIAVVEMAKYYLAQVQEIENHKMAGQGFLPTDLPGWQPAEKAALLHGGVKITFKKAQRQLGTDAGSITPDTWTLGKSDGELHLVKGKSTDYKGNIWEVQLPTGEVIEVNDEETTNTPKAQAGRVRFKAVTADGSASLERIRSFLQQSGLPMEEATAQDMENLYWRQLAGVLADRADRADGNHVKVWNEVSKAVSGSLAPSHSTASLQKLVRDFLGKGLDPQAEAEVWRKAWASLTSTEQVAKFVEQEGYLPRMGHNDIHSPQTVGGKPIWYRFDVTPEQVAKKKLLINNFSNYTTDAALIARSGGLYSSEARLRALGTYKPGMSWGSDQEYGSSGAVFLRQNMEGSHSKGAWVSPRVMARVDTYSYNEDHFGDITLKKSESYFNFDLATAHSAGGNEAMPSDAVNLLDDIEVLRAYDEAQRQQIIKDLKAVGITEIRGLPVEDRIATSSTISSAIAKAKKAMEKYVPDWFAHADEWLVEQEIQAIEEAKEHGS